MRTVVRQALLIAAKDTKIFFKDRVAVGMSFAFPFLFIIGFTIALGGQGPDDSPLTVAMATQETAEDAASRRIIESLRGREGVIIDEMDYAAALAAAESGEIDGFVSFPPDFSENLRNGAQAKVETVIGGASAESEATLRSVANGIADEMATFQNAVSAASILAERGRFDMGSVDFEALFGEIPPAIDFAIETVGEIKPFRASNFTLPGYLTMFVFFTAAMSAEAIARERRTNTLERLMANGTRREAIVLGKFAGAAYRGAAQLAVMWSVGVLAFRIDLGVSPAAVILISALMALASAAAGTLLASLVKDVRAANAAGVLASLTLAPLGGCWWPLFIAPDWMQNLAKITPHGWANTGFNKLMLFGAEFGDVYQEMIALALFGAAFLALALWKFRATAAE